MISTYVTIPEGCDLVINGVDYSGEEVHNLMHYPDGTGQFTIDYRVNGNVCQQRTVVLNKTQNKQVRIAFIKSKIADLERRIEKEQIKLTKLLDGITE